MRRYRKKREGYGVPGLHILGIIFGLVISSGTFSMAYGNQTCGGIAAGFYHTCVLTSDGNVNCYGLNSYGQAADYTGGNAVGVSVGIYHNCVLTSGGNVNCYGGLAADYTGGDAIGVAAGSYHTCVLTSGGNVDCYGYQWDVQSADYTDGDAIGVSAGFYHTCVLTSDGNVNCYGLNPDYNYGQYADYTGGDAIGVAAGTYHTCVLTSGGNVDCYGNKPGNDYGQSADYTGGDAIGVAAGLSHTCVLTSGGTVDCYGLDDGRALDYTNGDAVGVATGSYHTCVLTSDGNVDCYGGYNAYGELDDYTGEDALCSFDFFIDVPFTHWAYNYIYAIYNAGITTGYGDGSYRPTNIVNRAQMAAYIIRAVEGEPPSDYCGTTVPFPDVPSDHWSCPYIKRANELGIMSGFPDGEYKRTLEVNRAQMSAFITRGMVASGALASEPPADYCGTNNPFSDVSPDHLFCHYIKKLTELDIASGYPDGTYRPTKKVNRAQMAAFVARAFLGIE